MALCLRFPPNLLLSAFAAAGLAGCQSSTRLVMLPGPNFNAPVIEQAAVAAPPSVVAKAAPQPKPTPSPGSVPAAWIPAAGAPKRDWNYIVVHHSAGDQGGAKSFDKFHRESRGWDELGYHFVIGNGSETADGLVEVGPRWPKQKHGAHAKTPDNLYNDRGIGICLVGNFNGHKPTAKQMASLARLTAFLADRYGVRQGNIIGHKNTGKDTDCPGAMLDLAEVRRQVARSRVTVAEDRTPAVGEELVQSVSR
jgi:hypothetical protein